MTTRTSIAAFLLAFAGGAGPVMAAETAPALAPAEIVAAAPADDWVAIAPRDLLVMDLAPDRDGRPRRVVIQLMPAPFSQAWIGNIRTLAAAHWWDGTSVNRVQDNYVVQWGDANGEDKAKAKRLPAGLGTPTVAGYVTPFASGIVPSRWEGERRFAAVSVFQGHLPLPYPSAPKLADPYASIYSFVGGFPLAMTIKRDNTDTAITVTPDAIWPVHCYATVGVGRDMPPDTGSGAELYAVIGQAPRHLDRNIAVVGRVIEGIEFLSSLPRGTGDLGFYKTAAERIPIVSVRIGDQVAGLPHYEYLYTESASFAAYADARANRRDAFFVVPAGGADICNVPVPVRRVR